MTIWCVLFREGLRGTSTTSPEDELWRELGVLRRRVAEKEDQIDRQEAIIMALQQRASMASTPTVAAGRQGTGSRPGSGGQTCIGRGGQWDSPAEQQLRLMEVRCFLCCGKTLILVCRGLGRNVTPGPELKLPQLSESFRIRLLQVENSRLTELVALLQRKLEGM